MLIITFAEKAIVNILYNMFTMNILYKMFMVKAILKKYNKKERLSYEKRSLTL